MLERRSKHTPGTQWNEERPAEVYKWAVLGLTLWQMAEVMEVNVKTLEYWRSNKPEFRKKLLEGKEIADAKVAEAFHQNCFDRYVDDEVVHVNVKTGQIMKVKVKKFIQGDKWAQNKWLAMRQRALWAENHTINLTQNNVTNINKLDLSILSTQELQLAEKLGMSQLNQHLQDIEESGE